MVNANVVISVSAVLVALVLTLVIVMRQDGDPEDNFSVMIKGSYSESGVSYGTEMYYCTGDSCRFFEEVGPSADFPGYFALVGLTDSGTGDKYLTEHSIGQTFVFDSSNNLKECRPAMALDETIDLNSMVGTLAGAWNSETKQFVMDSITYTVTNYDLDSDPSDDEPKVLGVGIPTAAACRALAGETFPTVNVDTSCANCEDASRRNLQFEMPPVQEQPEQGERHLAQTGSTFASLCSFGYDGAGSLPSGWSHVASCINGNAVGRIASNGGIRAVSFAGTNDFDDVIQDMKSWGHTTYHGGFYEYVKMLDGCINANGGQSANYIVGHSLGGAAATIYKQISGASGTVVTFGAPKTTKGRSCHSTGMRIFNEKDPVASNGMGIMGSFYHDVTTSKRAYVQSGSCTKKHWLGWCTRHNQDYHGITGGGCSEQATGCSWLADCIYYVGRHSLDTYVKHQLGSVSI